MGPHSDRLLSHLQLSALDINVQGQAIVHYIKVKLLNAFYLWSRSQIFLCKFTNYFKLYIFTTQKNDVYINTVVHLTKKCE
jgi:hypothetical protein